jgi:putative endonuclease
MRDRRDAERRGRRAEIAAAAALALKGYVPLARRVKTPVGEIDLIVRRGGTLVAVEVKARPDVGMGLTAVGAHQQQRIWRALDWWLARRPRLAGLDRRLDLVLIAPRRWPTHVPNAFSA